MHGNPKWPQAAGILIFPFTGLSSLTTAPPESLTQKLLALGVRA
jgi:hypothetical protein